MKTNKPTIIRLILVAAAVLNEGAVMSGIASFNSHTLDFWYRVISFIFMVAVTGIGFYYNEDFTEEGCIGTGRTRQLKAEKKANYKGEKYLTEDEDGSETDSNKDLQSAEE